ncbi:YhdP family protein [Hymenobacter rigui]|nr:AsmA-like C-terminal region-containing protein [Hymenobacter rigui]
MVCIAWLGLWLGEDAVIRLFVTGLNRYLCVPVQASRLEVSALDQFPRLSVTLHDVTVHGSLPSDTVQLARARRLYCAFNVWDVVSGQYRIREITLTDARVHIRRNQQGVGNYHLLCPDTAATSPDDAPFRLALEGIRLERVAVVYEDASRQQRIALRAPDVQARVTIAGPLVIVKAAGATEVQTVRLGTDDYFQQKQLQLQATVAIDRARQQLAIQSSTIGIGPARYEVAGTIGYQAAPHLDLRCEATGADIQAVLALLPPRLTRAVAGYRSRGQVYFGGTVQGEWSEAHNPAVQVRFGCRNASFFHPKYQQAVEQVSLTGTFSNGAARSTRTTVLSLQNVHGQLAGRPFSGVLRLENFQNPQLTLTARANVDLSRAVRFFPVSAVQSAQGTAQVALQLNGPLRTIRTQPTARQASGQLTFQGVALRLRDFRQPFTGLTGELALRGSDVAFTGLRGRLGSSDFQAQGVLHNVTGWAASPGQPLRVQAAVVANLLDFNQLLYVYQPRKSPAAVSPRPASGGLHVPATLALSVQVQARQVRFRRLRGRQLRGTLRLQNQVFSSPGLTLLAAGGQVSVRGTVDARRASLLKASTVASCQQLPLDSLFYVFEDFGQQFLTARHLRGRLTATAESDTYFDAHLTPLTERLEAEVHATIHDGQLLNFEPLQRLSLVADRATLRHLRFAELHNSLYVQSRTVYIPQMDIRSNVRAASLIRVTGTHTFDQQLDYHVQIPLLPGLLPRAAARADGPGLRLAIQGTEDQFTVRYETGPDRPREPPVAAGTPLPASSAAPAPAPGTRPAERPSFELKKPVKKPAQPQVGEYFEF